MLEEIRNIFSIFHDGTIVEYKGDLNQLTLKIRCYYLAEVFNINFENFYLIIDEIDFIEFQPWMNTISLKQINKTDLVEIFKAELDIYDAKIENNVIIINCSQDNPKFDYCGGCLFLKAKKITVKNHLKEIIEPAEIYRKSEIYWRNFSN